MDERIKKAKNGDPHSFALLFKENYPILVKYLMKITMNPDTAEELAQETMTKCIGKIQLYDGKSKFSTWLISMATNLYIDQCRKKKREQDYLGEETFRKLKWYFNRHNEEWSDTLTELGKLPEEVRTPIILKHYYGYSYDEIGEMLKIASGTVKSRVHNGILTIRKELTHDGEKESYSLR
jgi:RNA polymerase sigma-70 factor (ECF subfamily)